MSVFGNVNIYNKATTVVRFFNATCSRYIDLLRNSCYCTSQVPIPPTLLTCLPHPWNIPQSTHLRNISSTKKHLKQNNTKHLSIKTRWKLSMSSSKNVTILTTSTVVPSRSVDSTLHVSHEDLRSTSPTPWRREGVGGHGGCLCTCGPVFNK